MGTMLQAQDPSLDDFAGLEGCNEILNVTRPDIVRAVHRAYLEVGVDAVETNTFGANLANLGRVRHRRPHLRARPAPAPSWPGPRRTTSRRRTIRGSSSAPSGPGTKLPTLGHTTFRALRDAYATAGRRDARRRRRRGPRRDVPGPVAGEVRCARGQAGDGQHGDHRADLGARDGGDDRDDAARVRDRRRAHRPRAARGRLHRPELRHRSGRDERAPALPLAARQDRRVGDAERRAARNSARTAPSTPCRRPSSRLRCRASCASSGSGWSAAAAAPRPSTCARWWMRCGRCAPARRAARPEPGVSSLYQNVPFAQDVSVLVIGERTNTNGSKAFRDAMLADRWEDCIEIARAQTRDGAHLLDLCVDYVGRDGAVDMLEVARRFATASTLPIMLDSTEPAVIEAGLEQLGGRCIINSVNFEDGDGPTSRFARVMPMVREHGAAVVALTIDEEGQARTRERKVAIAERLIADLTRTWGMRESDIMIDLPDVPDRHRSGGDSPRRHRNHRGHQGTQAAASRCADHAGPFEHLIRAEPGRASGVELGVPGRMRDGRPGFGDRAPVEDPADGADPGRAAHRRTRPGLRPAPRGLRPARPDPGALRGRDDRGQPGDPRRGAAGVAAGRTAASGASSTANATGSRPISTRP